VGGGRGGVCRREFSVSLYILRKLSDFVGVAGADSKVMSIRQEKLGVGDGLRLDGDGIEI